LPAPSQSEHRVITVLIKMLVLLLIPLALAVTPDNIRIIQQQSAIVADSALTQTMNRCMLNHFCAVGVNEMDGEVSDRSIASALLETYNVINTVIESDSVSSELPNMRKIKSAFELGQASKKSALCDQVFACAKTDIDLPLPSVGRSEVDCSDLAQVCPGLAIGCNLCGMFIPGLCAATCPMAGLFCGGSGYLCAIASGENPAPATAPEDDMTDDSEDVVPRAFMMKDGDMDGRKINPKMAMKRNIKDDEPEVQARSENGHSDDDGHDH